jgi:hypothetical protein
MQDEVDELRRRLLAQAFLYGSPDAYRSGVEAVLRAIGQIARVGPTAAPDRPATTGRR